MRIHEIYVISNNVNEKVYIGRTCKGVHHRFKQHCSNVTKHKSAIHNAINKHGEENFEIEVIARCESFEEACNLERLAVLYYNSVSPNGYNLRAGGEGGMLSEEARRKISESKKGVYVGRDNPMFGQTHTLEARRKISEARLGVKMPRESVVRGAKKRSGANNPHFGKSREEIFGYTGSWNAGIPMSDEAKMKRRKTLFWKSISEIRKLARDLRVMTSEQIGEFERLLKDDLPNSIPYLKSTLLNAKWNYLDRDLSEREEIIKYNQKVGKFFRKHSGQDYLKDRGFLEEINIADRADD